MEINYSTMIFVLESEKNKTAGENKIRGKANETVKEMIQCLDCLTLILVVIWQVISPVKLALQLGNTYF